MGRSGCQNELSPQLRLLFINCYLVAAERGSDCGFHTGRAAADDHYLFYFQRACEPVFPFFTDAGVDRAVQTQIKHCQIVHANIATDTWTDIGKFPFGGLLNNVRIGNVPSADGNQIGFPFADELLPELQIYPANSNDGYIDRLFDFRGYFRQIPSGLPHLRPVVTKICSVGPARNMDRGAAGSLGHAGDFFCFFDLQAAIQTKVSAVHAAPDGNVLSHRLADAADYFHQYPCAFFRAAAEIIPTTIKIRG